MNKYIQMDEDTRLKTLDSDEVKEDDKNYVLRIRKLLSNYTTDFELWNFLTKNSDTLSDIADLTIYRRSVEVGIDLTARTTDKNQEAYALLKSGEITAFNKRVTEFGILNLIGANLFRATLNGANLFRADLSGATLREANLSEANLFRANLREADLIEANLFRANLSGANVSDSLIIDPLYENLTLDANTTFSRAIIDDPNFIDSIRGFTNNVPEKIGDKRELKIKLLERIRDEKFVANLLSISRLPA